MEGFDEFVHDQIDDIDTLSSSFLVYERKRQIVLIPMHNLYCMLGMLGKKQICGFVTTNGNDLAEFLSA
jgi:hypothetical protein